MPGLREYGEIRLERANEAILRRTSHFLLRFFVAFFIVLYNENKNKKQTKTFHLYKIVNSKSFALLCFLSMK